MAHARGRPTDYTPELAKRFCMTVATSLNSIETICESDEEFPPEGTIFRWMHMFPQFREQYLAAKETQGIKFAESLLTSAVNCPAISEEIQKQTHVFRVGQWHYSKLAPKQFGDKKQTEQNINLNVHEDNLSKYKE